MADKRTNPKVFSAEKIAELMNDYRGHTVPIGALDPFFRDYIKLHKLAADLLKASKSGLHHELDAKLKELDEII